MAQHLAIDEVRNFKLSTGDSADLIKLISADKPATWVRATGPLAVGTVAYIDAMGRFRRGVVVKCTKTKTHVAFTTQGAVDDIYTSLVRVQITVVNHVNAYVNAAGITEPAPAVKADPAPVAEVELDELPDPDGSNALPIPAGPWFGPEAGASAPDANRHASQTGGVEGLTLHSQAGKVTPVSSEDDRTEEPDMSSKAMHEAKALNAATQIRQAAKASVKTETAADNTGSAVVKLMEKVWKRVREDHPELPEVVIVTGSGLVGGSKWGHFRRNGWNVKDGETMHEMFMAGETLAKGATQVLQTMLHEGAHTLAEVRGIQDTSRQGRWHNGEFKKHAAEMGLEHKAASADKSIGYSYVTLTEATRARYADLLEELATEIRLMCRLPGWLGGSDQDDEDKGGEKITGKPTKTGGGESKNTKAVCGCQEPNIIRLSDAVLELGVVRCDRCDNLFQRPV